MFKIDKARLGPALALLALFVVATIGSIWATPPIQTEHQHQAAPNAEEKNSVEIAEIVIAEYTKILTWFTGVLAVSTVGLWIATLQTFWHGRKTSERELRAYVTLEEGKLFGVGKGDPWFAMVKIKNGGQTPAYDVKTHFSIEGGRYPLDRPILIIPDEEKVGGRGILGPNGEYVLSLSMKDIPTQFQTNAMMAAQAIVWVTGRVTYRDIFDNKQWTTIRIFCGGELGYDPNGRFAPHATGNDGS